MGVETFGLFINDCNKLDLVFKLIKLPELVEIRKLPEWTSYKFPASMSNI